VLSVSTAKIKQPFILQPHSCGLLLFSGSTFYHQPFFQLVLLIFFNTTHSPSLPHHAEKKIMQCIAINQPPVVASTQAVACF
jgi:hypothetical protein